MNTAIRLLARELVPAGFVRPRSPDARVGTPLARSRRPVTAPANAREKGTGLVLWLMILLVFLPIAAAHVAAQSQADQPAGAAQAAHTQN